ncbi:MAG: Beta-barrel assembly-enhancing protease [Bacteroidia bacterium]|nr:Beta-barrel assembly-enhancing protease [Bacteroidia bacterium]
MNAKANLERKQKYSHWRAAALIGVYLLMGIHIVHWKIYGNTLAPLELNEVLYTLHLGIITAGFIFMGVTLIGTIIFGRFFCSWACHILALQDLSEWLLTKFHIKPKPIQSRAFIIVPVVAMLYLFVWPQFSRIISGKEMTKLHLQTDSQGWASFITNDFWRNLPNIPVTLLTFFVCGFAIIYFLGTRSFCQKVCPYGVIFSFADKLAPGKIKLSGDCNQCGLCTAHCRSHIIVHKEIEQFGKVVNSNCLKDLDCVAVCPNDAIKFGFTKPSFFQSFEKLNNHKTHYAFSVAEDILLGILTLVLVIIFRGLYDAVPFLLAITIAVLLAWFSVLFLRIFTKEYVHIGKIILKQGEKTYTSGKYFIALMLVAFIFSAHSAYVHYHNYRGDLLYNSFIKNNQQATATEQNSTVLKTAKEHLEMASNWGIFTPLSLSRELAAIYLTEKDYRSAETYLNKMLAAKADDNEARLRLAKLYFVSKRENEAIAELQKITTDKNKQKDFQELKTLSEAHLTLGHIEEKNGFASSALNHYRESLKASPENMEAMLALGVMLIKGGQFSEAEKYLKQCSEAMPSSALVHNNLSAVYIRINRHDEAIYHLNKLVHLQPENPTAHYNLGMLLLRERKNKEAAELLQKAIVIKPDYANAHIGLAKVLEDSGEKSKAEVHKQKAVELKLTAQHKN